MTTIRSPRFHPQPVPGTGSRSGTSTYSVLLAQVKEHGLLARRTGFYWSLFGSLVAGLALAWVAFAFLGDSWFQLIVAGALGVSSPSSRSLSHEAAHRQVFASQKWNDLTRGPLWLGTFLVGLSYSWWKTSTIRHHGNPNTVGKDPDIAPDGIRFLPEDPLRRRTVHAHLPALPGLAVLPAADARGRQTCTGTP